MFAETFAILQKASLTLPAMEVITLLAALTVCLVLRFTRVGLIVAYLFVYRWGWACFVGMSDGYLMAYLVFGTVAGILTVIGMLRTSNPVE